MPWQQQLKKAMKNKHNWLVFLIVLIGIALIALPTGRAKKDTNITADHAEAASSESNLEKRLSSILENVEGAGKVSVMITYASGSEKAIAYDTTEEMSGTDSDTKSQKQAVVSGGDPVILKENTPAIKGVLVVADGAGNAKVQLNLVEAVKTVLGIDSYQVTVLKKGI